MQGTVKNVPLKNKYLTGVRIIFQGYELRRRVLRAEACQKACGIGVAHDAQKITLEAVIFVGKKIFLKTLVHVR